MRAKQKHHRWPDAWPSGTEEELLLRYAAFLRRQEVEDEYASLADAAYNLPATPVLDEKIKQTIAAGEKRLQKKRAQKGLRRVAATVAIILLCLLAVPTVLFAVSEQFRETVYNFILDWREGHVEVGTSQNEAGDFIRYYLPGYLPPGFSLDEVHDDANSFDLAYINDDSYIYISTGGLAMFMAIDADNSNYDFEQRINGYPAIVAEWADSAIIIWHDDITAYKVETNLSLAEAIKIAANLQLQKTFP